jgi:hypothetical protein
MYIYYSKLSILKHGSSSVLIICDEHLDLWNKSFAKINILYVVFLKTRTHCTVYCYSSYKTTKNLLMSLLNLMLLNMNPNYSTLQKLINSLFNHLSQHNHYAYIYSKQRTQVWLRKGTGLASQLTPDCTPSTMSITFLMVSWRKYCRYI